MKIKILFFFLIAFVSYGSYVINALTLKAKAFRPHTSAKRILRQQQKSLIMIPIKGTKALGELYNKKPTQLFNSLVGLEEAGIVEATTALDELLRIGSNVGVHETEQMGQFNKLQVLNIFADVSMVAEI